MGPHELQHNNPPDRISFKKIDDSRRKSNCFYGTIGAIIEKTRGSGIKKSLCFY
jgi:hypothetical protein